MHSALSPSIWAKRSATAPGALTALGCGRGDGFASTLRRGSADPGVFFAGNVSVASFFLRLALGAVLASNEMRGRGPSVRLKPPAPGRLVSGCATLLLPLLLLLVPPLRLGLSMFASKSVTSGRPLLREVSVAAVCRGGERGGGGGGRRGGGRGSSGCG